MICIPRSGVSISLFALLARALRCCVAALALNAALHGSSWAQQAGAPAAAPVPRVVDGAMAPSSPAAGQTPTFGHAEGQELQPIENPYGLAALWRGGDLVAKATLLMLAIMSTATWTIMIVKWWEQAKVLRQARGAQEKFFSASSVEQGMQTLAPDGPFHLLARAGQQATQRHVGLLEPVDLNTWISMSIQRAIDSVGHRLQDGLAVLATVASTAPFVGLFGTVWGIYHALTAIGIAGQASIDKVAGPVGEALIMTAMGLAVAVPAVLGYNWLVRRNKLAMEQVRSFASDLHAALLSRAGKP